LANLRGAASGVETSLLRNKAISTAPVATVSARIIAATASIITAQTARTADLRERSEPDLAHASLVELFAFCFNKEELSLT